MMIDIPKNVDSRRVAESIELLQQFLDDPAIEPLISALEALQDEPDNESLLTALADTFAALGIVQGAVLTYAPYIGTIVPNNLSADI